MGVYVAMVKGIQWLHGSHRDDAAACLTCPRSRRSEDAQLYLLLPAPDFLLFALFF